MLEQGRGEFEVVIPQKIGAAWQLVESHDRTGVDQAGDERQRTCLVGALPRHAVKRFRALAHPCARPRLVHQVLTAVDPQCFGPKYGG